MLVVALILVVVAAIIFAIDFARGAFVSLVSLGLALFASGVAAWLVEILHTQRKL